MTIIETLYRLVRRINWAIRGCTSTYVAILRFRGNGISIGKGFKTQGIPYVIRSRKGYCRIGADFTINNNLEGNPIGRPQACTFIIDNNAKLIIGNNVGISSTAIVAHCYIEIQDNVRIGGGVCIYDTDFHSLKAVDRLSDRDRENKNNAPILIKENVFIGAHATILKGVTIGSSAVIGACSVVTKDVPDNEVWAGNPARFIRSLI